MKPLNRKYPKPDVQADPKEIAQEAVHQVMPKKVAKKLLPPVSTKPVANPAQQADNADGA